MLTHGVGDVGDRVPVGGRHLLRWRHGPGRCARRDGGLPARGLIPSVVAAAGLYVGVRVGVVSVGVVRMVALGGRWRLGVVAIGGGRRGRRVAIGLGGRVGLLALRMIRPARIVGRASESGRRAASLCGLRVRDVVGRRVWVVRARGRQGGMSVGDGRVVESVGGGPRGAAGGTIVGGEGVVRVDGRWRRW